MKLTSPTAWANLKQTEMIRLLGLVERRVRRMIRPKNGWIKYVPPKSWNNMTKKQAFIEGQSLGWDQAMDVLRRAGYGAWIERQRVLFIAEDLDSFLSWAGLRTSSVVEIWSKPVDLSQAPSRKVGSA